MNGEPRFITDASLAGLAKWLRILGYDTAVYHQEAGRAMMRQAQENTRILLTRRTDMTERQFSGRMILLPDTDKLMQLAFIVRKLSLKIHPENLFSICLSCNEKLTPVDREDVRSVVPEYVYENCQSYNRCPKCGKIYWPGTHVQNTMQYLKDHRII